MPHITIKSNEPGIRGLFRFRPETARPLNELVEASLNECRYCSSSHSAYAAAQLPEGMPLVEQVCADVEGAPVSAKLKALLEIASAVREGGSNVTGQHVAAARAAGATCCAGRIASTETRIPRSRYQQMIGEVT